MLLSGSTEQAFRRRTEFVDTRLYEKIPIRLDLVPERHGAHFVAVDALLFAIQSLETNLRFFDEHRTPGIIDNILFEMPSVSSSVSALDMATTRVPDFGSNMQHPNNGFRKLVEISRIHNGEAKPSKPYEFDLSWDLISMQADSAQSCVQEFKDTWRAVGMDFRRHFFLVFIQWPPAIPTTNRPGTLRYSPISSSSRGSSPRQSAMHNYNILSQSLQLWQSSQSRSPSVDSSQRHHSPAPAFNPQFLQETTIQASRNLEQANSNDYNHLAVAESYGQDELSLLLSSSNTVSLNSPTHSQLEDNEGM